MATKKQKRAKALAARAELEANLRESGLKAQQSDKARREAESREAWQENHDKNHHKFVDECPHCSDVKKMHRSKRATAAISKMPKRSLEMEHA